MARLLVFCEAAADFRTISGLVERVLREEGPSWLRDLLDGPDEGAREVRDWVRDGESRSFFDVHNLSDYVRHLGIRAPVGHFNGEPGAPGALMAFTAFRVADELVKQGEAIDAVILVWDMDDQDGDRAQGLDQARAKARSRFSFAIVLGLPNPEREAWVLAGFEPENEAEKDDFKKEREKLGFSPSHEAHRLVAKRDQAIHSAKRVLSVLTNGNPDRAERCLTVTPLDRLRERGQKNGLAAFLKEISEKLLPLCSGTPTASRTK